jgi:hypothetical protein
VTRSGDCETSIRIQRLHQVSGRTKPRRRPHANPSPHSVFSTPSSASQRGRRASSSTDERPSTSGGSVPEAPPWAPHRCACPPLGGRATVEWPQWRLFAFARTDEVASVGSVEISTPCAHPQEVHQRDLGPSTRQLVVVQVLLARLADPRPTVTCEVMQVSIDPYLFSSDRVTSFLLLPPQPQICALAWL